MLNEMTGFNKQLINILCILTRQNGGELHGGWTEISAAIACDIGSGERDEISRLRSHLQAVGFDYLCENSPLQYFFGLGNVHHFVERGLLNEPGS